MTLTIEELQKKNRGTTGNCFGIEQVIDINVNVDFIEQF